MGSCSLLAVTNLAGFGNSPKFLKCCNRVVINKKVCNKICNKDVIKIRNKVETANSERDPNYVHIFFKKPFFFFFF